MESCERVGNCAEQNEVEETCNSQMHESYQMGRVVLNSLKVRSLKGYVNRNTGVGKLTVTVAGY